MLTIQLNHGSYDSPPRYPLWPLAMAPSAMFYLRAFSIVWKAAQMAKKGIYTEGDWAKSSLDTLRALESCGVQFQIRGMEQVVASHQPCVFIGNHMSTLETFILPTLIAPYRSVTFVVKQSLIDYPLFKYVMRSRNPVVVNRSNPREDLKTVLEQGCQRLNAGTSVVVFPQTTRTTQFDAEQFNTIGIKLAKKAGVPIIPLALKTDCWGNGRRFKDFGAIDPARKVHFEFGAELDSAANPRQLHSTIVDFIQNKLHSWEQS